MGKWGKPGKLKSFLNKNYKQKIKLQHYYSLYVIIYDNSLYNSISKRLVSLSLQK